MKRIIIFRFDREAKICGNHLGLIQRLNPDTSIHGIFGGEKKDFPKYKKYLGKYFKTIYCINHKNSHWKWQNFDLALRDWYKEVGRKINFDMAYIVEWDLILTAPIEDIYSHIKKNQVGLTGLIKLSRVSRRWSWVTEEPDKSEWLKLLDFVKKKYKYSDKPFASLGPGLCLPKVFFVKYSKAKATELAHDELRVPLYAQIFGLECKDTGFQKKWYSAKEEKYFNCSAKPISLKLIKNEMRKSHGRRAFHPFRLFFN